MKTQLKLELNMKKTLLARVVKGIAVCGLAMSSISYAATSVNAVHNVVEESVCRLTMLIAVILKLVSKMFPNLWESWL
ncbi:hypothetical protein [Escherichia coli]|uniref:hypothetical protein n=1 Tax=Escherichia coli TaxID=562 RepID=UPI000AF910C7|nr:hypothetical protein [Escherichia coli]